LELSLPICLKITATENCCNPGGKRITFFKDPRTAMHSRSAAEDMASSSCVERTPEKQEKCKLFNSDTKLAYPRDYLTILDNSKP